MSFVTPQVITINSVATDFHRTIPDKTSSTYVTVDGSNLLKISHQETKSRVRHLARLDRTVVAADPLTAENAFQMAGCYLVIDEPLFGFTDADLVTLAKEFIAWLTTANLTAIVANRH